MKGKMVVSCLKLKQNNFKRLKQSKIMAQLNIYHFFDTALVLIRSRRQKREKKNKKEEKGVSGSDLYLLIEQLAVLIKV